MENHAKNGPSMLNPLEIADRANRGFIGFGQMLMRVINFPRNLFIENAMKPNSADCGAACSTVSKTPDVRWSETPCAEDRRKAAPRSEKGELEKRDTVTRGSNQKPISMENGDTIKLFQYNLKSLFNNDPLRRMSAVKWIRQHRAQGAAATLESVLLIEEDKKIRDEIVHTLSVLNSLKSKGEDNV